MALTLPERVASLRAQVEALEAAFPSLLQRADQLRTAGSTAETREAGALILQTLRAIRLLHELQRRRLA